MGLTRKQLTAMGIEAEKIEEIISSHAATVTTLNDTIDKLNVEISKLKKENEQIPEIQKKLDEAVKKSEADAKEREGKDYDKLKKEFDEYKADVEKKTVRASKETAYKVVLKDAGVPEKYWGKILKYSDVDGVELDDKGEITTKKELLKSIREEWGDHIPQVKQEGAEVKNPPENTGGTKMTREQIMGIKDRGERQKAIAEHHDLFGF